MFLFTFQSVNPSLTKNFRGPFKRLLSVSRANKAKGTKYAVIVGCYDNSKLSNVGEIVDKQCEGKLSELLQSTEFKGTPGKTRIFYGLNKDLPCIAVAGLGKVDAAYDENEDLDTKKENVRLAIGAAAKQLQGIEIENVEVDACSEPTAASEAATLGTFVFDQLKSKKTRKPVKFSLSKRHKESQSFERSWNRGIVTGDCQNYARYLMELPANYKTPTKFADLILERMSAYKGIDVIVRDRKWLEEKQMGCFLGVAQGSAEPPVLVEMRYNGASSGKTVAVVGKGVTFDTGGISIKPSSNMAEMKGDMGGAACTVSCVEAACRLGLDINVVGLVALTENMPSSTAVKPGDVLTAMNGKTVEVDNTDAEGRLILADALHYAHTFNPSTIIDLATLTGAMRVALGYAATGTYTTSTPLWKTLNEAGQISGDRLWRMPLYKHYSKEMDCSLTADLKNVQKTAGAAGSCTAAAFLKEFVTLDRWAHLDIAGVMSSNGEFPYISQGMTGRPTRTLVEALELLSKEN